MLKPDTKYHDVCTAHNFFLVIRAVRAFSSLFLQHERLRTTPEEMSYVARRNGSAEIVASYNYCSFAYLIMHQDPQSACGRHPEDAPLSVQTLYQNG